MVPLKCFSDSEYLAKRVQAIAGNMIITVLKLTFYHMI